jgi:hypothetical protein
VRKSDDSNDVPPIGRRQALAPRANALRTVATNCGGSIAVEFAIIIIPFLLLLIGAADLGFAMLTETRITFAVEAAAKCGAIGAAMCASASETAVYGASVAGVPGLGASGFVVTTATCGLSVTATYPYTGMVLPAITLKAAACYPAG